MTRNKKLLVGGLALVTAGAAAAGAVARHGGDGWRHHGGGHHGWSHHRRGKGFMKRPMRMVCGRRAPERIDHMLVRLKHKVDITEAQTPAFEEFADTVRTAVTTVRESCPPKPDWKKRRGKASDDQNKEAKPRLRPSPIERLTNMEKLMAAGLEAIRTVRPSAEKLYASLSEEQQTKLRQVRGKRGWWKHKRGHRRGSGHGGGKPKAENTDKAGDESGTQATE